MYTFYQAPEDDGRGYYITVTTGKWMGRQQTTAAPYAEVHCDILYDDGEGVRVEDQLEYVWHEIGTAKPREIADFTWGHIMGYDEIFEGTLRDWVEARRAMAGNGVPDTCPNCGHYMSSNGECRETDCLVARRDNQEHARTTYDPRQIDYPEDSDIDQRYT